MTAEPNRADWFWRAIFVLLALVAPILLSYDIYFQWHAPVVDFGLDWQTGSVTEVPPESLGNYAGFMRGDIILTAEGVPFAEWRDVAARNYSVEIARGDERLAMELPVISLAQTNLPSLTSAAFVILAYWSLSLVLLWRRFRQPSVRLIFTLSQTLAIALLYPLAHPPPRSVPLLVVAASVSAFYLIAPQVLHLHITFPTVLGNPRVRRVGLVLVYAFALASIPIWYWGANHILWQATVLYAILTLVAALALFAYVYTRRAASADRRRLRLILLGTLFSALPPNFLYLLPRLFGSPYWMPEWLSALFLIVAPVSYIYAVARHNLFGIDRLLNRALVYAILSLGIFLLYLGPFLLLYRVLPHEWFPQVIVVAALTLFIGWNFDWIRTRVQRAVDRFFYGGWYDYPGVVEMISDALARCIARAQLNDVLTRRVPTLMQLGEGELQFGAQSPPLPLSPAPALEFPLTFQNEPRAVWRVRAHRDGEDFTATDRRILATLARQAETALGNVLLVETLRAQLDEIRSSRATLAQTQHQLLRSREEERARLARDLHDGPIQDLVGLNMQLGLLLASGESPVTETLKTLRAQVRDLLTELRQVCAELRPPMLDTIGLGAALRVLADEWSSQTGITVALDLPPDATLRSLPSEVAVNLYRLAQETLTNSARHANANSVAIQLEWDGARLSLTLRDDGRGFAAPMQLNDLVAQGHFGLAGMQERAALIGAALTIATAPGTGTTVRVAWPSHRMRDEG